MCITIPGGKVVGLLSSTYPVARTFDREIYRDDVEKLIKTSSLYFIGVYIK